MLFHFSVTIRKVLKIRINLYSSFRQALKVDKFASDRLTNVIRTRQQLRRTVYCVSEFSTLRSRKGTFLHYCLPSFSSVNIKSTVCRNRLGLPNVRA